MSYCQPYIQFKELGKSAFFLFFTFFRRKPIFARFLRRDESPKQMNAGKCFQQRWWVVSAGVLPRPCLVNISLVWIPCKLIKYEYET